MEIFSPALMSFVCKLMCSFNSVYTLKKAVETVIPVVMYSIIICYDITKKIVSAEDWGSTDTLDHKRYNKKVLLLKRCSLLCTCWIMTQAQCSC